MSESVVTLSVRDAPVSLNRAHSRHWSYFRQHKRNWQQIWERLLMASGIPKGLDHVHAEALMRFPVARRRDEGNFRWMLEKSLGDALVNGRWLDDDTPERFTTGAVTFEQETGPKRTVLTLTYRKEQSDEVHPRGPSSPA